MGARKSKRQHGGKRPGAGRPPLLEDPVRFILSLERRDVEALEEIAVERGQSIASLVRRAVAAFLKRRRR